MLCFCRGRTCPDQKNSLLMYSCKTKLVRQCPRGLFLLCRATNAVLEARFFTFDLLFSTILSEHRVTKKDMPLLRIDVALSFTNIFFFASNGRYEYCGVFCH